MTKLLAGKAAIVTGAGRGIGFAIAEAFVDHGASVLVTDVDGVSAAEAGERLRARGGDGDVVSGACDVTDAAAVDAMVSQCVDALGHLDVMVNNAGITRDGMIRKMTVGDFDAVVAVHLRGTWLGTRAASVVMRGQEDGGSIINMSSISGKTGNLGQTNYSAAKAGIVGLTKAAAKEGGRHGIRVNALMPGLIRSAMTEAMPQAAWESKIAEIPMERPGEPSEVADVAVFLASSLSSYVSGAAIEITGGRQ